MRRGALSTKLYATKNRKNRAHRRGLPGPGVTNEQWLAIVVRQRNKCVYCTTFALRLTQDHYVPLAKGGHHTPENIVGACLKCNTLKRDMMPDEFMARLKVAA